jgi:apolipoprotein N-acyltransferase
VLVVGFAAALVLMTEEEKDRRPLEAMSALILALTVAGAIFSPDAAGAEVRVAIVQGNSPCPRVHCENEKQLIYNSHLGLTTRIERDSVDLIVWAENAFGGEYNPTYNPEVAAEMAGEAVRVGAYLLAGGTRSGGPGRFENVNVLFSPEGKIVGEYMKRHPVPFGEYVPLRDFFEFIPQLDAVPRDMTRGEGPVVFPVDFAAGSGVIGSVISFEGAFARHIRSEVKAGAQMVVVTTNEGSYGRSPASDQLIGMVRMSAASLGVDVVQAAITGHSTYVGADGTVSEKTDLFTDTILYGTVNLQEGRRTFYTVAGDWLQLAAIAIGIVPWALAITPQRGFKIRPGRGR